MSLVVWSVLKVSIVSVEGFFIGTPGCERLHCYGVTFPDSHGLKVF